MTSHVHSNSIRRFNQRGFTLIELLLVLLIMIGLAAVLIPLFGNIVGLTHAASSSANIEETARALENHKAIYGGYPNQLDLLLTDHTDDTSLAPFGATTVDPTELTTTAVTDRIADALLDAGIIEVVENPVALQDEEDQTIFGLTEVAANDRLIAVSDTPTPGSVVILGANAIARLGLDPAGIYVVLGVGNNNDAIGRSMLSAPVHFLPDGGSNEDIYSRFLAVFSIPDEEGPARLANVVTVDVHDGEAEILGLDGHVREYHHAREQ